MSLDAMDGMSRAAGRMARDWTAKVIAPDVDGGQGTQSSFVASDFAFSGKGPVLLHASAYGVYRAFVNGQRVGAYCLTPGWTCCTNAASRSATRPSGFGGIASARCSHPKSGSVASKACSPATGAAISTRFS